MLDAPSVGTQPKKGGIKDELGNVITVNSGNTICHTAGVIAVAGLIWGIYVAIRGEVRGRRKARITLQAKIAGEQAFH